MRIVATEVETRIVMDFKRELEDGSSDTTTIKEGDDITIQYIDISQHGIVTAHGVVKKIASSSHLNKKENLSLIVDASTLHDARKLLIPMENVIAIDLGNDMKDIADQENATIIPTNPSQELPEELPISWGLDKIGIKDNLLEIPYVRLKAGEIRLTVSRLTDGKVYFKEFFNASTSNNSASFTWSLRSFENVASEIVDEELLVEDGFYIYQNGDSSIPVITKTDNDNNLIVPAGTELLIQISYSNGVDEPVTITTQHTVTIGEVETVTSK